MKRRLFPLFVLLITLVPMLAIAETRIVKVLPFLLDTDGRQSLSPSLFERDAYQYFLHAHPEKISTLRFDVQWKGKPAKGVLKIELRYAADKAFQTFVIEKPVEKHGWLSTWSQLELPESDFKRFGQMSAWRVTLCDDGSLVSEQKSFLW